MKRIFNFWKSGRKGKIIIILILLMAMFVCCISISLLPNSQSESSASVTQQASLDTVVPTSTPEPTNTSEPTAIPEPTATVEPIEQLNTLVSDALGTGNRDVQHLKKVTWSEVDRSITIEWAIDDNFSDDWIKRGAEIDIKNVLKAISQSDISIDYQTIMFDGSFSMVDVYGNTEEDRVVLASYSRETLGKINWENFLTDNVFTIADTVYLHPAFK